MYLLYAYSNVCVCVYVCVLSIYICTLANHSHPSHLPYQDCRARYVNYYSARQTQVTDKITGTGWIRTWKREAECYCTFCVSLCVCDKMLKCIRSYQGRNPVYSYTVRLNLLVIVSGIQIKAKIDTTDFVLTNRTNNHRICNTHFIHFQFCVQELWLHGPNIRYALIPLNAVCHRLNPQELQAKWNLILLSQQRPDRQTSLTLELCLIMQVYSF